MYAERLSALLVISWLAVSTLLFPALLLASLLQKRSLLALAGAAGRSAAGIPVYSALVWNECVAIWYALGGVRRALERPCRKPARVQTEEPSCR